MIGKKGTETMLHELEIRMLPGEAWWGGLVNCGCKMPLTNQSCCTVDPFGGEDLDQGAACVPVFKGTLHFKRQGVCALGGGWRDPLPRRGRNPA